MTQEMLFEVVRALVHKDWNVSVDYCVRSWAGPEYGLTIHCDGMRFPGFARWADTPNALLKRCIEEIIKCMEAPDATNA